MKLDGLKISESCSSVLMNLYNAWVDATAFLSNGNCNDQTWLDLVEYGTNNVEEFKQFALDYLNSTSDWTIMSFIDAVLGCPINHKLSPYVDPKNPDVVLAYKMWLTLDKDLEIAK